MIELETPRDFKKKINDGIVTRDMLLNVIFAFNKRAKIYKEEEKNLLSIQFCKKIYTGLKERKLILMI